MKKLKEFPDSQYRWWNGDPDWMEVRVGENATRPKLTWQSQVEGGKQAEWDGGDSVTWVSLGLAGKCVEQLDEVEGLDEIPRIDALDLGGNELRSLAGLGRMPWAPGLKRLYIDGNPLARLDEAGGLGACPGLEVLHAGPGIETLAGLAQLRSLKELWVYGRVGKLEALEGLGALEDLAITSGTIQVIEGLDTLVNLKRLDLSGNRIERMQGLDHLVSLKYLNLANNQIAAIEGIDSLDRLERVDLKGNPIPGIEQFLKARAPEGLYPGSFDETVHLHYLYKLDHSVIHLSPAIHDRIQRGTLTFTFS